MTEASNGEGYSGHMDSTVPISLKLLATHLGVGAVIGKHGGSITEIQVASGAKIQISGPNEVFPGTTERIMHISGEMLKVCHCTQLPQCFCICCPRHGDFQVARLHFHVAKRTLK